MKFYVLESKPRDSQTPFDTEYLPKRSSYGEAPRCKVCGEFIGPMTWLPPYVVELELWGLGFGDLAFFAAPNILVSAYFKTGYEENELKGLQGFEPVEVVRVKKHRPIKGDRPSYYHAIVQYSRAVIDDKRSDIVRDKGPICKECRVGGGTKRVARVVLKRSTWSGEDIFVARGLPSIFLTTEKFKTFCQDYKIKNAILIPAEEYGYDLYPWEKGKKGSK
jgi:hypothetical protein